MVVAEGRNSSLAAWSESDRNLTFEYVKVLHDPEYDHIVLHTPQDPEQSDVTTIVSSTWRIGIYKNWVEAARRWRTLFEQRTMAKPLWNNRAEWVRKIHAVHGPFARHYAKGSDYAQLANIVPPENLLYFMWNGDRIVLFGDHTLIAGIAAPQPRELQLIKKCGWRLLLYHPWTLYYSQTGAEARLQKLRDKGWLQHNYQFNPDYEGTAADWYNYWADVDATYSKLAGGKGLNVIHPGSTKFKNYLVRNYQDLCSTYQADGSYFDILGADKIGNFAADRKIIEGQDYATGEKNAIARLNRDLPNLPVMSEYIPARLIPYVFYTWEGYYQYSHGVGKVNHPLRTALIGSYVWSQEQDPRDSADFNNEASALLGALPSLSLVDDYKVSRNKALYSQARCKLFCQEELFNDLPPKWDPGALAYYRSKSGHWFKFKKFGENQYAYVEEIPGGNDLIRLTNLIEHLN
jgi:hypothetical protein